MDKDRRRELKRQAKEIMSEQDYVLNDGGLPRLGLMMLQASEPDAETLSDPEYLAVVLKHVSEAMFPLDEDIREINVQTINSEGDTVLHYACLWGDARAVRLLLASGSDVNSLGDMERSPLHVAVSNRFCDIVEILLSHGAHTNKKDSFGDTPLELADQMGYQDVSSLLGKR